MLGWALLGVLSAQAEKFPIGTLGELSVVAAGDWKITGEDLGDKFEITIAPARGANATATIRLNLMPDLRFESKRALQEQVRKAAELLLPTSVEKKAVLREYYRTGGYGCYCQFTDPERLGKLPEKGNYTVLSAGIVRLSRGVIASVSIFADDFAGDDYQSLLGAAEGMEFRPAPAAR